MIPGLHKHPKLVGAYVKQKREALGLSQRELGLLFTPPVTTQFISNVERGVTPLPPSHVPAITKILNVPDQELMALLEKEYAYKLSNRLGKTDAAPSFSISISNQADYDLMKKIYEAYSQADHAQRQSFHAALDALTKK